MVYKVLSDYDPKPSLAFSMRIEGKGLLSNKLCNIKHKPPIARRDARVYLEGRGHPENY